MRISSINALLSIQDKSGKSSRNQLAHTQTGQAHHTNIYFPRLNPSTMESLRSVEALVKARPILSAASTLALGFVIVAYHDYRSYVALGPHGLPNTFWGWYRQLQMTRISRKDTTAPAPYDLELVAGPHDTTSFLPATHSESLSWRPGNQAPEIPGFVAPQRQTTQQATASMKKAMYEYLDSLAASNSEVVQIQTSVLEGPVPAMGMKGYGAMTESAQPKVLKATRGEMCHIHPPDGSTHLILSLADQKRVIELGWGRRHRLSGGGMLPWNYTFIYAPRNVEEMAAWRTIVHAAVQFCCADVTSDIHVPVVKH